MSKVLVVILALLAIGVLDRLASLHEQDSFQSRRVGFHQGKTEAKWLYFFISHIYDSVLNPWHWDETMRNAALKHAKFEPGDRCVDVGAGTGFTSEGVVRHLRNASEQLVMLDQSLAQLAQAEKKRVLDGVPKLVGDAEALPANWTSTFDRYTSAGSIEYWPAPHVGISEAFRVLRPGGRALMVGPVRPTFWLSRFFADLWYLFPEEQEYVKWFTDAGFQNVQVHQVSPAWYDGDRSHGLIMGCIVVGDKSGSHGDLLAHPGKHAENPPISSSSASASKQAWDTLMVPSRFLLGNLGGIYYALLPIGMFLRHHFGMPWFAVHVLTLLLLFWLMRWRGRKIKVKEV